MDNIFKPNQEIELKKTTELYTLIGKHKFLDDANNPRVETETDNVFAKKIVYHNNSAKYYIKVGTYGKIYNPIGLYSEGTSNKFLARAGKKAWDFKEVNSKIFNMYVKFLKTKNIAWLTNAEREMN